MAATEVLGRSFSDALYERYCDFESTFDELKNDCDIVFFVGSSPKKTGERRRRRRQGLAVNDSLCLESGLVLHASTVVLTDERISHVGDPHAIRTSCLHVELVDISSNALSDWQEVCGGGSLVTLVHRFVSIQIALLLSSLPHVKTINLSFNPFPSHRHRLPDDIQWANLNTLCLNGSHISFEMITEVLKKTPK